MEIYKDPTRSPEERAADLLARMTIEEKVAQTDMMRGVDVAREASKYGWLNCTVEENDSFDFDKLREEVGDRGIGYVHDIYSIPAIKNKLQKFLVEKTRLGIPCIFTAEALHGVSFAGTSIFPVPLTLSQTFDPDLIHEIGDGIASETRAIGHHEILAPNLDVSRDPRWGRTEETFGEDTYLSSEMAVAIISGEQKGDISRNDAVIAEPKHYCVHGMPEGGLNCATARVGQREVETCYLPVFEAGIKRGGAYNVMTSYNSIDGELVTTSEHYLKEVLKERFELPGIARGDWGIIERISKVHHLTKTNKDAVRVALTGGLDMKGCDIPCREWEDILLELLKEGSLPLARLDDIVFRVLKMKFELGLFENPYTDEERYKEVVRCEKHKAVSLKAAEEAIVILKNDGILPIGEKYKKIALIGPSSAAQKVGGYSSQVRGYRVHSVYEEMKLRYPEAEIHQCDGCAITHSDGESVQYVEGQPHLTKILDADIDDMIEASVKMAKDAEVAVLVCGDNNVTSGEGMDRGHLVLSGKQREMILSVAATGTPVILVLENGKAIDLSEESKVCSAIVVAGFGGEFGARAIVKALAGDINPAGRLSVSYPRDEIMLPCYYSKLPGQVSPYVEGSDKPLYAFGHGLSYTAFTYSDLKVTYLSGYRHLVEFTLTNTGERDGDEVAQLYINDTESSVVTPCKLLRKFKRISLKAGESKQISWTLDFDDFKLLGLDWKWKVEPGEFEIMVGASSEDIRLTQTITIR